MVAEQIKNYPHFTKCETLLPCTRLPLFCVFSQISSAHTRRTCLRHIMTSSSHLYQRLWNGLTSWGFPTKMFLCISLIRVVCPVTLSSLIWWTNNVLFNVVCKHEGNLLHPSVTSFFLRLFSQDTSPDFWHIIYMCILYIWEWDLFGNGP